MVTVGVDAKTLKSVDGTSIGSTGSVTVGGVPSPSLATSSPAGSETLGAAAPLLLSSARGTAAMTSASRDSGPASPLAASAATRADPGKDLRAARVRLAILIAEHVWGDPAFAAEAREIAHRTDRL